MNDGIDRPSQVNIEARLNDCTSQKNIKQKQACFPRVISLNVNYKR